MTEPSRLRQLMASQGLLVTVGLLAGLAFGMFLAGPPLSTGTANAIVGFIEPVGTLWINAVRMTVIPLVVPLLIVGVAGSEDRGLVGTLGLRSFGVFLAMLLVCAISTGLLAPWLFESLQLDAANTTRLRESAKIDLPPADALSVRGWLVSLVPINIVSAAADGALLPIVLFTLLYAFALTRLPDDVRAPHVAFFRGMSGVMLIVVRWLLALAPIGIFALATTMGQRLGAEIIGAIGFYMSAVIGFHIAAMLLIYVVVTSTGRVGLAQFTRAMLPAQVVGFGSRSSLASLPALVQGANQHLRLPAAVTAGGVRLAGAVLVDGAWLSGLFRVRSQSYPLGRPQRAGLLLSDGRTGGVCCGALYRPVHGGRAGGFGDLAGRCGHGDISGAGPGSGCAIFVAVHLSALSGMAAPARPLDGTSSTVFGLSIDGHRIMVNVGAGTADR